MSWTVTALLTGKAQPFRSDELSAIAKSPVSGPVRIGTLGLEGDEQAEAKHHGGPHMAVHHYPAQHHEAWRGILGDHALLADPGAFGSNLCVDGLGEEDVRVGDRFRLGTALLEVSQPRQPCWKIEHRFGRKGMVAGILRSGRCGWYYRVLEEGEARAGDVLEREYRADDAWRLDRVFAALWGDPKEASEDYLRGLAALDALTPKLREKAAERLASG